MTLARVETALEKDKNSIDYPHLTGLIKDAFSTFEGLNGSFPLGLTKLSYSKPGINFDHVGKFYDIIQSLITDTPARLVLQLTLDLLKKPRHKVSSPSDIYFLLIILENPRLYSRTLFRSHDPTSIDSLAYNVLERSIAILSHTSKKAHHYFLNWIARYPVARFTKITKLLNAYIANRLTLLTARPERKHYKSASVFDESLIPMSTSNDAGISSLGHGLLAPPTPVHRRSQSQRSPRKPKIKISIYGRDWRIVAFATILAIFFNSNLTRHQIPIALFYNKMVDNTDFKVDYDAWERLGAPTSLDPIQARNSSSAGLSSSAPLVSKLQPLDMTGSIQESPLFAFCQFPFLFSLASKKLILEYDARRQMELEVREAFFNSLTNQAASQPYLHIKVNRNNLLRDSFDFLSKHEEELKKAIRVEFVGEPGIDAGGLKKEWFLLLVRELFAPSRGLFSEDEESRYCWFNTVSSQPLMFYKLTGVVIGLALYNSINLDVNFAPCLYKRLLGQPCTLEDFTKLRPSYGKSLQVLLDYEGGDFESTFGLTFSVSRQLENGQVVEEPLASNGLSRAVTKSNRSEYVRRVIAYFTETAVKRQFEPLKQGVYKVLGNHALVLLQAAEIELLVRGSDEDLDFGELQKVTKYKNWNLDPAFTPKDTANTNDPRQYGPTVVWFWEYFAALSPKDQRKLLMFVTGSDRVPATGLSAMSFKISRLGGDSERYPVSHTCFNELGLYEYASKNKLVAKLDRAVRESEGFGLK